MHKLGQVGIFVQLLMETNFEQLRTKTVSKQINICLCALNLNYVADISITPIFKFKSLLSTLCITGKLECKIHALVRFELVTTT